MSRVYWHTEQRAAELYGSERAWLNHIASGPAAAAWDLDGFSPLDRAVEIVSMIPQVPDGEYGANYLHTYMRTAVEQEKRNKGAYEGWRLGQPMRWEPDYEPIRQFVSAVQTRINGRFSDDEFMVAGHRVHVGNVALNTALAVGAPVVQLAAKIHGWCEGHCYIEGEDREWVADLIDDGLNVGVYRRELLRRDDDGTERRWSQGWEDVQALLRETADGPVVLSYSVCDSFPNPHTRLDWPGRDVEKWDDYTEAEQRAIEEFREAWYDNEDHAARWSAGMEYLRQRKPWARLAPDTLGSVTFGPGVTVYDLLAPDRDERVTRACEVSS